MHNTTHFYSITKLCNFIFLWQLRAHQCYGIFPSITVEWNWNGVLYGSLGVLISRNVEEFLVPLLRIHFTHNQIHQFVHFSLQWPTSCNQKNATKTYPLCTSYTVLFLHITWLLINFVISQTTFVKMHLLETVAAYRGPYGLVE